MSLREDTDYIITNSIQAVMPDAAVKRALENITFGSGKLVMVSIGKAGWQMAKAAVDVLGSRMDEGIVITKYGHVKGQMPNITMMEAGHPIPDENAFTGTEKAIEMVQELKEKDTVLFLVSGGGSALFEKPLISPEELETLTAELLASGADITEMNTIRKRFSAVKGGRFAKICEPARVESVILSDIVGDPLDMIASGPAYPDSATKEDAWRIVKKYSLTLSESMRKCMDKETPKTLFNVRTQVNGSVKELVRAAATAAESLGYEPIVLTDCLNCEAREAGLFLANIAKTHQDSERSLAFIAGGETVVHLRGQGKGGRNQEIALAASLEIIGCEDTAIFSVGSDGTDGPTDAAGGYADGETAETIGVQAAEDYLNDNDAYTALQKTDGLIITGPTGTNVNDVAVVLIKR